MNLELIRKYCEKRPGGLRKLAADIGMSEANLHRCINNNKIQAGDLEKIAGLLNVSVGAFFNEGPQPSMVNCGNVNNGHDQSIGNTTALEEKVKMLERIVEEKERTIQILMKK